MGYFVNSSDEAEAAFYGAFGNLDLDLMRATWLSNDSVFCVHPGGRLHSGLETVINGWRAIFEVSRATDIAYTTLSVTRREAIALHLVQERIGSGQNVGLVLATNGYVATSQGWRMLFHHASQMPKQFSGAPADMPVH